METRKFDHSDKMKLIREYLQNGTDDFFTEAFEGAYGILMVVDWREEDDAIIQYCEDILKTGHLSAEFKDADNIRGFNIIIHYNGKEHNIPYTGKGVDRDTTVITLNEVIQPDYEIRLCIASKGSDTLEFLPLTAAQWAELEEEFGAEKVTQLFEKITKGVPLFG